MARMTRPSGSSAPSAATFASLCFCVFVFLWLLRCITVFTKQSTAVFRRDCTFDPHQVTFPAVVCTFVWKLRQCGRYSGGTVRPLSTYKLICFDPRDMDIIQREWRRHR